MTNNLFVHIFHELKIFRKGKNINVGLAYKQIIKLLSMLVLMCVFLISGIGKFFDPYIFIETIRSLFRFNEELLVLSASVLPLIEICVAFMLLFNIKTGLALDVIFVLLVVIVIFSIYGAINGVAFDCGCFGKLIASKLSWGMVFRNIFFLMLTIISMVLQKPNNE